MERGWLGGALIGLVLLSGGEAAADHMTGRYAGTGPMAGSVLELWQTGSQLVGQLTGPAGTFQLQGQQTSQHGAAGILAAASGQRWMFQSLWDPSGLRLVVAGTNAQGQPDPATVTTLFFTAAGPGGSGFPSGGGGFPPGGAPPAGGLPGGGGVAPGPGGSPPAAGPRPVNPLAPGPPGR